MLSSRLLVVFLVGASSLAVAQGSKEETSGRVSLREGPKPAPKPGEWVEIASPTPAKHGTEFIGVGGGSFSQLRIDAAKGRATVRRVRVMFSDGTNKTYPVGKTISENGRKFAVVDLGGPKAIDQLVLMTEGSGEYAVYGSSAGGGVVSSR